jgi:hypothetical protein
MQADIFLDSNVFDFLFASQTIDLAREFPREQFRLWVTCEIGAFEVPEMPVTKREFANATVKRSDIKLDAYFGWFNPAYSREKQRVRGFNQGRWITTPERDFIKSEGKKPGVRPTGLNKDEADVHLAARSFLERGVVSSLNYNPGPLTRAGAPRQGRVPQRFRRERPFAARVRPRTSWVKPLARRQSTQPWLGALVRQGVEPGREIRESGDRLLSPRLVRP